MEGDVSIRNHQLYSLSTKSYVLPHHVDLEGKLRTRSAENIPIIRWPDGSWCHPANRFILELFERGLSRINRGGSLATAAAHITHLIRFCWARRMDPIDLNDNDFRQFVDELKVEKRHDRPHQSFRSSNAVIAIGRSCISFLDCTARYHQDDHFIGPQGRIRASLQERAIQVAVRGADKRLVRYWHHAAFPEPSAKKKRLPIASADIEKLRGAIAGISRTPHQRMRRHVMLKLLEMTPARRGEIALITVESVVQANRMDMPMLFVPTLKKGRGRSEPRYIPLSRADARFLAQYAEFHRRTARRRAAGGDHGLLLINGRTGDALLPNTITQEIRRLADAAGIRAKACPHMFRHRFITKLFVALIEQHHFENPDEFRRALIDGEGFKRKVAEWTGHSSLASLNDYINLAFDEVANFGKTYSIATATLSIDSFIGTLGVEIAELRSGEIPLLWAQRMIELAEALRSDLIAAKVATDSSTSSLCH